MALGGATATTPLARRLELYADANYLHRFDDDVFASVQTRGVLELLHTAAGSLEAFTRMSAVGDRRRFPWANVGEGSVGVTIVPGRARRFVVMAEQVGGVYLRERPVPGQSGYGDFRVTGVVYFYSRLGH